METVRTPTEVALQNILVATDFSPASERALRSATSIAARYDSTVHLVHVIQPTAGELIQPATISQTYESEKQAYQAAEQALKKKANQLTDVRHEIHLMSGTASELVEDLVGAYRIDLVVIGTRGTKGLKKIVFGSTAEEIFRSATCPVLTVGPNTPGFDVATGLNRILFPSDLASDESCAMAHAISLARQYCAHLVLLHVIVGVQPPPPVEKDPLEDSYLKRLQRLIPADLELPHPAECRIAYRGPAGDVILQIAGEIAADLIVLSVSPEEAWATRLPDTAYRIVAGSLCPVLTVREKEGA